MPNFYRHQDHDIEDDLDIAARVMETVQRQIASYHEALQTVRTMRKELIARQQQPETPENPKRRINTPALFAELLEERGVPQPLSKAMAAEDFQDPSFQTEAAIWTWDCCCSHCCLTCDMGSQVTGCPETFIM
jgi:hypothetical protein